MKKFLYRFWPVIILLLVTLAIVITNYIPGTYLIGWDNLMPEFNFGMNIQRSIFSVWEEYQGVGLLAGMAHASDLPHQIFLWFVSFVLPNNMLRYFYHFLMLFVGMLGVYALLKNVLLEQFSPKIRTYAAILGALFYALNLGTVQYFYVPFEPYSTFWGLLPWELLTLFNFLKTPTRKNLWLLVLANIVAIPQAYVQTVFLVYCIVVGAILLIHFVTNRNKQTFKKIATIIGVIFVVNAFWLLPNLYFTVTEVSVTQNAMQNQMATEKFFQMNKLRGTIFDFPLLREFYYDFFDLNDKTQAFDYLMKTWREYFSLFYVQAIGYVLFFGVLLGIVKKTPYRKYLIGIFIITAIVFLSNTIGFSIINDFFRSLPIVNQIFRNPFTKFIVPTVLVFAAGFGVGMAVLLEKLQKDKRLQPLFFVGMFALIIIYMHPIFTGDFFSKQMRVKVPNTYFQLFSYMEQQDTTARIMNLPQGNYWGWEYYSWGLHGSGFLWYGIEQPILDRAFDVWSQQNENYYWQLSYALNTQNKNLFNSIIDKYQIRYIIFDQNLIFANNVSSVKQGVEQQAILINNAKVSLVKKFGKIYVYKTQLAVPVKQNITTAAKLSTATVNEQFQSIDQAFLHNGAYVNTSNQSNVIYPFGSLFTNRFQNEQTFKTKLSNTTITFSASVPKGDYTMTIPSLSKEPLFPVAVMVEKQNSSLIVRLQPQTPIIRINNNVVNKQQAPYDITIPLTASDATSYILDVNGVDFFALSNLSNSFTNVGTTYLNTVNLANYIKLFANTPKAEQLPTSSFVTAHICGAQGKNVPVNSQSSKQQLSMQAKNTAGCSVFGGSITTPANSLVKTNYTYKSASDEFPQYCYYSQAANGCLNQKDTIRTGFSNTPAQVNDYFENNEKPDTIYFQMILDAGSDENKNKDKKISYSNISLTSYPYIAGGAIDFTNFASNQTTIPINLTENGTISITVPKDNNSFSYQSPIAKHIYKTDPLNYDKAMPGAFGVQLMQDATKIRTFAQNASSYLLFRATNLVAEEGYLATLQLSNVKSFPFTVNIFTNQDFRTYTYTFAAKK